MRKATWLLAARGAGQSRRFRRMREPRKRVGKRAAGQKENGAGLAGSAQCFSWLDSYAAAFLTVFGCAVAGGLGAAFFAVLAFSFSANSCLTLAAIASVSTL